jgi:hypothetical protein
MRRLIVVSIFLAAASVPPGAQATLYCRVDPDCVSSGGTAVTDLQQAMDLSSSDPDLDRIEIGDTTGFVPLEGGGYHSDYPLEIVGAGPALTSLGGATTVLSLGNNSSVSVSGLTIVVQAGTGGVGLELAGATADHIAVTMQADSSSAAISSIGKTSNVDDALVELGATAAPALRVANGSGLDAILNARHVTVVGSGSAGQVGGTVAAASPGQTMVLNLRESILEGIEHSLTRSAPAGTAVINTDYSNYDPATQVDPPNSGGINPFEQTNLPPGFVDRVQHDFRLAPDSDLIDAGEEVPPGPAEPDTDLAGNSRRLNGDSDCVPEQDMGAYEFVAPVVFARASATPLQALTGQAVTFDGTGSCDPDPAATLAYNWSFDDGGAGSGPSLPHAFATAGNHSAQLIVTSSAGRAGSASATVGISSPPSIGSTTTPAPVPFSRTRLHPPVLITRRLIPISRTGIATIALKCEGNVRCVGRVRLQTLRPVSALAAREVQKLGSKKFSIPAGRTTQVKVRIARSKVRVISTRHRLAGRASVTDRDSAGRTRVVTRTVQLKVR